MNAVEYEMVRDLFPNPTPCDSWVPLQNGFEGLVTARGAYRLRRRVTLSGGFQLFEIFSLTRGRGLQPIGFARPEGVIAEKVCK